MTNELENSVLSRWRRLGALVHADPSGDPVDIEQLLADTARVVHGHARLFDICATWLVAQGDSVDVDRLVSLAEALPVETQAALGVLLALAVEGGASRALQTAAQACRPADDPAPLFDACRGLEDLSRREASPASLRFNRWAAPAEIKPRLFASPRPAAAE